MGWFSRKKVDRSELIEPKPRTAEVEPTTSIYGSFHALSQRRPPFTMVTVDAMMTDPRVMIGLDMIKGPILTESKFFVDCDNEQIKTFLTEQIERFWLRAAHVALRSIEYGYVATEVMYKEAEDGLVHFDTMRYLSPRDTRIVTKDGCFAGIEVQSNRADLKKLYIGAPKAYWSVHRRDWHQWYGRSRLYGAYLPWHEIWTRGGYRDIRFLWYYKYAYQGPRIHFPVQTQQKADGSIQSNQILARQLADRARAGHSIAVPRMPDGSPQWEIQDAKSLPAPEQLLDYGDRLEREILVGMGIPPEVIMAEGTGAFAGRLIPMQAFYSTLKEIVHEVINDFDEQVLRHLVRTNFGYDIPYNILTYPLGEDEHDNKQDAFDYGEESYANEPFSKGNQESQNGNSSSFPRARNGKTPPQNRGKDQKAAANGQRRYSK